VIEQRARYLDRPTRFVGSPDRRRGLALVCGEPGIGKTALLDQVGADEADNTTPAAPPGKSPNSRSTT
jgi:hypothetical protein